MQQEKWWMLYFVEANGVVRSIVVGKVAVTSVNRVAQLNSNRSLQENDAYSSNSTVVLGIPSEAWQEASSNRMPTVQTTCVWPGKSKEKPCLVEPFWFLFLVSFDLDANADFGREMIHKSQMLRFGAEMGDCCIPPNHQLLSFGILVTKEGRKGWKEVKRGIRPTEVLHHLNS